MNNKPTVTIFGHVCIDHNIIEGSSIHSWGSPAMYIANYYSKFNIQSNIISSYGSDFTDHINNFTNMVIAPTSKDTLIYHNVVENGTRVQYCLNPEQSPLVPIQDNIIKIIEATDILIIAPDIPNYTAAYVHEIIQHTSVHCLRAILPQGLMREIAEDSSVKIRSFSEAKDILSLFDVLIISDEDTSNPAVQARAWSVNNRDLKVVVTQADKGATLFYNNSEKHIPTLPLALSDIVNPVGAGDTFSAQLIMSLFNMSDIHQAIKDAHTATYQALTFDVFAKGKTTVSFLS
jgi:sugar/nucleoside kinase (ribokinase family)